MNLQEAAYRELATLYSCDLGETEGYELLEYAVITACIRYRLKGVAADFLEQTVDELSMADQIFI